MNKYETVPAKQRVKSFSFPRLKYYYTFVCWKISSCNYSQTPEKIQARKIIKETRLKPVETVGDIPILTFRIESIMQIH